MYRDIAPIQAFNQYSISTKNIQAITILTNTISLISFYKIIIYTYTIYLFIRYLFIAYLLVIIFIQVIIAILVINHELTNKYYSIDNGGYDIL